MSIDSAEKDEIKMVIFRKLPIFLLGAAFGLALVWVALQFIPSAALRAFAG
jgi:hypothetical protein